MNRLCPCLLLAAALGLGACELNTEPPTGPVAPAPVRDASAERTAAPPFDPAPRVEPDDDFTSDDDRRDAPPFDASDEAITDQIRQTLAFDEWLSDEARQIDVSTQDGVVTLRGRVQTEDERYIVLDIAWETEGVRDVIDQIEVRGDGL